MPTTYRPRPARCSNCGDLVVVAEHRLGRLFGSRIGQHPQIRLEHADPGPDGELFDAVDEGCRRRPPTVDSRH